MKDRTLRLLFIIVVMTAVLIWIDWPDNPGIHLDLSFLEFLGITRIDKNIKVHQGLDLQGGLQVLLEADVPEGEKIDRESMDAATVIVENRVNSLGVTEPLVQTQGERRIIVELPGVENPDEAIATFRETGLLEFIDAGTTYLEEGTVVRTTTPLREGEEGLSPAAIFTPTVPVEVTPTRPMTLTEEITPTAILEVTPTKAITLTEEITLTPGLTFTPTSAVTGAVPITATAEMSSPVSSPMPTSEMSSPVSSPMPTSEITGTAPITAAGETAPRPSPTSMERVFTTVMTGKDLDTASVGLDQYGKPEIRFLLKPEGAKIFADFTAKNVGKYLAIALDKVIISCPVIQTAIPDGSGRITGRFDLETARRIAIQLRYGALPIPLRVETVRSVGPTLGQDSVQKSIRAGAIGVAIVLTFMLIYYRLPGFLADLALIIYGLLNFAIYKFGIPLLWPPFFQPVTLTLPGITGFILSTGMAVDANILIFERMKEEIRAGRSLRAAIDAGFDRAWTSIRDSNLSTILSCIILFWFGSNFGASIVKGFAITLGIGVVVSMFTAITVTRTFIRFVFDLAGEGLKDKHWLLGI